MKRVALIFSGGGSNMVALAKSMATDHPGRPALAICNIPGAGGIARAQDLGIETQIIDHRGRARADFDAELANALNAARIDIVAFAGFMRILSPAFFDGFAGGMLNIHPSLLPKYPGLHTHQRAIDAGDDMAGCSVHEVIPELDAGPILGQARVPILAQDTADTLAARVLVQEHVLYPKVLRAYCAGDRTRQDIGPKALPPTQ